MHPLRAANEIGICAAVPGQLQVVSRRSAEVRLNEVPVWGNAGGAAARVMLSINEGLFAGENTVELFLTPLPRTNPETRALAANPQRA